MVLGISKCVWSLQKPAEAISTGSHFRDLAYPGLNPENKN